MEDRSAPGIAPAIASVAVCAILLAIYLGGYFGLCVYSAYDPYANGGGASCRTYSTKWLANVYRPLAFAEGAITGVRVETDSCVETVELPHYEERFTSENVSGSRPPFTN
jgi:hypothetical protein